MTTENDIELLVEQVRRLQDREDLREVTARYAMAVNKVIDGVDVDALSSIFAEDATWEARGQRVEGLAAIMEGVRQSTAAVKFSVHAYVNPVFVLDGDAAWGRWVIQMVGQMGEAFHQGSSVQDFTYVRTPAGWRIGSVTMRPGKMFPLPPAITGAPPRMSATSGNPATDDAEATR